MTIPSFNIQPGESSSSTAERRKIAMLLMRQGMDTSPVAHWTQGAARVAQAMLGGMALARADQSEKAAGKKLADALVPEMAAAPAAPPAAVPSGVQRVAAA